MNVEIKLKFNRKYDTKSGCWILYSKKYNISGYGKTLKQAEKMVRFTLDEILTLKNT